MNKNAEVKASKLTGKKIVLICVALIVIICMIFIIFFGGYEKKDELESIYPADIDVIMLETDYCNLTYPEKWEEYLRVDIENGEHSTIVNFYGTVEEYKEQLLFAICFGGDGEIPLGTVTVDGVSTDVGITYGELDVDEWQDGKDIIYAMQDDANFTISQLKELNNFEENK